MLQENIADDENRQNDSDRDQTVEKDCVQSWVDLAHNQVDVDFEDPQRSVAQRSDGGSVRADIRRGIRTQSDCAAQFEGLPRVGNVAFGVNARLFVSCDKQLLLVVRKMEFFDGHIVDAISEILGL
jgi:hypothetical protein